MKAIELLCATQVSDWFARMEDDTYRWVNDDLQLLPDGPDRNWVEHGIRTPDTTGIPIVHPVPNHDENLMRLNQNLEAG